MKSTTIPIVLATTVLLAGCTRMKLSCDAEPSYPFKRIETYQWVNASTNILEQDDTFLSIDLQKALNNELAAKGWTQVLDPSNATVQATYYLKIKSHEEYTVPASDQESELAGGFVYKSDSRKWNYEPQDPKQQVYTVETGTLHFLMNDTATGQRIFTGTVETEIDRSQPEEKRLELFRQIARKLAEQIP